MSTPRIIHKRIQEISKNYFSGTPPIHIDGLMEGFNIPKETLQAHLQTLVGEGKITFYNSSLDVIRLTDIGTEVIE